METGLVRCEDLTNITAGRQFVPEDMINQVCQCFSIDSGSLD